MLGMNTALETLAAQAVGAKNFNKAGVYLYRARAVLIVMFIPIGAILFFSEPILVAFGQDPAVSKLTGQYLQRIMPATLANMFFDANRLFLFAMGYNLPPTIVTLCAIPLHFLIGWVLIFKLDMGLFGCCWSVLITQVLLIIALQVYSSCLDEKVHNAVKWPGFALIFSDWGEYLSLGIPGAIMVFMEWFVFDVIAIEAGWIGVVDLEAMTMLE